MSLDRAQIGLSQDEKIQCSLNYFNYFASTHGLSLPFFSPSEATSPSFHLPMNVTSPLVVEDFNLEATTGALLIGGLISTAFVKL